MPGLVLSLFVLTALGAATWLAAAGTGNDAAHRAQAAHTALCLGTGMGCTSFGR